MKEIFLSSNKIYLSLILLFITLGLVFFPLQNVIASGFQVKTVGSMNVDGVTYNHLWYTNGNVTFTGITPAGTDVTATIDGSANPATVDADGNWTYAANLSEGDHSIDFSSSAGSHAFTLTIGPVPEGVGGLPEADAPTAGSASPTIFAIIAGTALAILGMKFLKTKQA